jgi:hypothetical protein
LLTFVIFVGLIAIGFALRNVLRGTDEKAQPHAMTEDHVKQEWRKLGFFCELDAEKRVWTLTGSRAGLLYFPDLLLGYVNDPANAADGASKNYGPYGSLEIRTYPDPGFDGHAIRGSLMDLTRLAELVEAKLASAQSGETVRIREEFAPNSPFSLLLDVRPDGFDPASADRERLGAAANLPPQKK